MNLRLRPATAQDIDAVVAMVTSAYRGEASEAGWTTEAHLLDGQRTDPSEVIEALEDPRALLLLAEQDDTLVGCIKVDRGDDETAHFGMFAVSPTLQGGGVGGRLLDAAEEQSREWGCSYLALEVLHQREDLQTWYRRRGYEPTGDTIPFPYGDERWGLPKRDDLYFDVFRLML